MELSLDLSLSFVPKTISLFLGDVSRSKDMSEKLGMLEDFLRRLEDEMRKIDAFKRELPLCVLLVNDAVTKLKEEKVRCLGMQQDPPVAAEENGALRESCDNKKNWMSSVQLWSTESNSKPRCEEDRSVPENPIQTRERHHKNTSGGALFNGNSCAHKAAVEEVSQVPSFSLMIPESQVPNRGNSKSGSNSLLTGCVKMQGQPQAQPHQHHLQQNPRKQRRCWSPELHRRFIDALHQLGGAQVATPKQIREMMQVEGLTNDEVKSHLQKYRLHVRRFPEQANNNNGLWVAEDKCAKGKGNSSSQSGSPQGPLLLGGSVKGLSSPGRNSADAEDEQSDCRNWKGGLHWQPESCD